MSGTPASLKTQPQQEEGRAGGSSSKLGCGRFTAPLGSVSGEGCRENTQGKEEAWTRQAAEPMHMVTLQASPAPVGTEEPDSGHTGHKERSAGGERKLRSPLARSRIPLLEDHHRPCQAFPVQPNVLFSGQVLGAL